SNTARASSWPWPPAGCPGASEHGPRFFMSSVMRYVIVGIVVVVSAWIGWQTFSAYQSRFASGEPFGNPFTLSDHDGAPITEAAFRGHPSAVFFGFTHCPEVCPTTLFELDAWLKQLGDEGKDIRAYFV